MKKFKMFIVYTGISLVSFLIGLSTWVKLIKGVKVQHEYLFIIFGIVVLISITNISSFITSLCFNRKLLNLKNMIPILIFLILNILYIFYCLAIILVNYLFF